jgi:hypothetical protein
MSRIFTRAALAAAATLSDAGGKLSKIAPKALAVQSAQTLLAKAK